MLTPLRPSRGRLRWLATGSLALACGIAWAQSAAAPAEEIAGRRGKIHRVTYEGPIHPIAAEIVTRLIGKANAEGAALAVVEIDTPGGLMTSMQDIKKAILNSRVPVAVYVYPRGAQAASAGFFILMAADVAAMSPGSTTGAAHPVNMEGKEEEGAMGKKILQSAVSEVRSMAEARGRNPDLAVQAVMGEVKSFTAEEAVKERLVDFVADGRDDFLRQLEGREVRRFTGERERLLPEPKDTVVEFELSLRERILGTIADPNVLFILMGLGMLGLYVEISHPGLIFPGVLGAICLILALFASRVLPINYAGVVLILLAFAFFIAEIKVVSYGLLTAGGLVSLLLGGMLLVKEPAPGFMVDMSILYGVAFVVALSAATVVFLVARAHRVKISTGLEALMGREAEVVEALRPDGKVLLDGEYWNASCAESAGKGERVRVVRADGLSLFVERINRMS